MYKIYFVDFFIKRSVKYNAMHRPIGYIRQQTVNCDFIVCSKNASVNTIHVENLIADKIKSPTLDQLLETMQNKIQRLEDKVNLLESAATATFTAGSTVASTLHFDDVDLSDPNFDLEAYQLELRERLAQEAGVPIDKIVIIDLAATGSATARVEIQFPATEDPVSNQDLDNKKAAFLQRMNDPSLVSELLSSLGEVQVTDIDEGEIKSINAKLFQLENKLHDFSLEDSKSLRLDTYKFEVQGDELSIKRYDHDLGAYVGGTLNIDS